MASMESGTALSAHRQVRYAGLRREVCVGTVGFWREDLILEQCVATEVELLVMKRLYGDIKVGSFTM
ncbi:hypothetical protein K450DRAFT_264091 [Umbelopsis ramanniana AG]|uniref:Uncharacterized protein n=1 Tax=Umbelopsis ramanniana AG TaxID=1314678 RepID=A0AAD5E0Y5_UMBRA|nr:uncharacterized protein K450DRAFT_264091 [Umbelopsis ramanniana AG]KAI8574924.1 hypothetical protein K450DRAFT_264091 [Umbelopsis ramanniana AG]